MAYLVEHDLSYWPAKIQRPSLSRSNFTGEWGGGKNLPSDLNALKKPSPDRVKRVMS